MNEIVIPIKIKIIITTEGEAHLLCKDAPHKVRIPTKEPSPSVTPRSRGREPKFLLTPEQSLYCKQHNFPQFRERFPELIELYGKRLVHRKYNKAKKIENGII